ncbi:MAG TPA: FHA domain-containing protein [Microlunatus sp.]
MLRVHADLQFSVAPPTAGREDSDMVTGTVRGDGGHVQVQLDSTPSFTGLGDLRLVRILARWLAAEDLSVSLVGADGLVLSLGAGQRSLLSRMLVRSKHVQLGPVRNLLRAVRQRGRTFGWRDLIPPTTPIPMAPTFRRLPRRVTTTHDPYGGGSPRLFFPPGLNARTGPVTQVFYLRTGATTTIGSDPANNLVLDRVDPQQAEIRRTGQDEYVVVSTGTNPCRVNGEPIREALLRTGTRIEIGEWTMVYFRAEYADHGRPYGGRVGGEAGYQRPQPVPTYVRGGGLG